MKNKNKKLLKNFFTQRKFYAPIVNDNEVDQLFLIIFKYIHLTKYVSAFDHTLFQFLN